MADDNVIAPKGAQRFDLLGMGDQEFESLCFRLVRLEFPDAFKPANTADGGADAVLPNPDGGYSRCWQAKHYPKSINWTECRKSLAAAIEHWSPKRYSFCFPRELTAREQKTFDKHFRAPEVDVRVDYWNGEELQARLVGSSKGLRVARTFFPDPDDREKTYRAIEAAGRLDTPEDALNRMANIGGFLASGDAFFSYPATTHEVDGPAPEITPQAVMSVLKSDGTIASRVDVVPRDADAMERYAPQFVLRARGDEAVRQLQKALREGKELQIQDGVDVTFTRLPPAMEDMVGQRLSGVVTLGPAEREPLPAPAPWDARIRAETEAGTAEFDVVLRAAPAPPEGWEVALTGSRGGLTVTAMTRRKGAGGELTWNFRYIRDDSPVKDQVAALKLFQALSGIGTFVVTDRGQTGRPELRTQVEAIGVFDKAMQALLRFLEAVRIIEQWAQIEIPLPDEIAADEVHSVALVAEAIRRGGQDITWHQFEMTLLETEAHRLRPGRPLRIEMAVTARVLGQIVDLGFTRLEISEFSVASLGPVADKPGFVSVRIQPPNPDAARRFQHLTKERTKARKPPPPPRKRKPRQRKKRR